MNEITEQTVDKIARLARLQITGGEQQSYAAALTRILNWVEQLGEVDTQDVAPLFSVHLQNMPQREDQVVDGRRPRDILANAPECDLNMFTVPKVVE